MGIGFGVRLLILLNLKKGWLYWEDFRYVWNIYIDHSISSTLESPQGLKSNQKKFHQEESDKTVYMEIIKE